MITHRFAGLKSLLKNDFALRDELILKGELFGGYNAEMEALQTANGKELESLIERFGWPDKEIDGEEAVKSAWYIVMHAISLPSLQRKVLGILESDRTACLPAQLAMLEDRVLVFSGKKQKYGTQMDWNSNGNLNPYPIENIEQVDLLRKEVNLPPLRESIITLRERAITEQDHPQLIWLNIPDRERIGC
jgi:hypothetical protein